MAGPPAPDWLSKRDGALKPGAHGHVTFVLVGGSPQYKLEVRPAAGQYACAVQQSVNGRRLDDPKLLYPTAEAAVAGGLDQLRAALGW